MHSNEWVLLTKQVRRVFWKKKETKKYSSTFESLHMGNQSETCSMQPSQNQPAASSTSWLLWRFDHLLSVRKYIKIMMKLMSCYLPSDRVWKKKTNYATVFGRKMRQLYVNQTRSYRQISAVDKIYKNAFWTYQATVKEKAL